MSALFRLSIFLIGLSIASPAWAQATRTWVSGVGDDANPCSRTAPCKTLAGAISKTAAGGEINAIDSGGFGAVTITKSITIDLHNILGGILSSGTNGFVINVAASDTVVIRGADIHGGGTGLSGVKFIGAGTLRVEDSNISRFTNHGIEFTPSGAASLFVKNTVIGDNGTTDLHIAPGTNGSAKVTVEKSSFVNSPTGVNVQGASKATLYNCVVNGHATYGIRAGDTSAVNVERGVISNNGVAVQGDSKIRISEVMLSHNETGIAGTVESFGNNRVSAGNTTNGAPTSTLPQQ